MIKKFNTFIKEGAELEGFPMLIQELDRNVQEFGKIDALKYILRNGHGINDSEMLDTLKRIIQNTNETFTRDYLNEILDGQNEG